MGAEAYDVLLIFTCVSAQSAGGIRVSAFVFVPAGPILVPDDPNPAGTC
jgi:hypothetical protein